MSIPEGYRLIATDASRAAEVMQVTSFAFAYTPPPEFAEVVAAFYPFEAGRALEVADASRGHVGTLAAAHTSFRFRMAVPGGRHIATAGLTWVSVHPSHRRRGLLTTMIADHFDNCLRRGEPLSALYASETEIYQRFGYGLAAREAQVELARGTALRSIPGADELVVDIESASFERHASVLNAVQARMTRPGTIVELEQAPVLEAFLDPASERKGAEELRIVIVRDGDTPLAFALLSRTLEWGVHGPHGTVAVRVWGSADPRATARLVQVLVDFDLMSTTTLQKVAVDDEFLHTLKDPRAAKANVRDNLWLRVLDVPAALHARGYAADCDVTVQITDAQVPANAGTWRLRIVDGEASVTRTDAQADLAMDIQELSAAYLGGTSIVTLARAGLIDERSPGSAQALSRAFVADLAPVTNIAF